MADVKTPAAAPAAPQPAPALPPAPEGFVNVFVDGELLFAKKGSTVMSACSKAGKQIPHFCFHERLSIAGNCRMCLVEIEGMPKPIASCHWPVAEGMKVRTASPMAEEARKGTMELLLANHPLDCPICDQGGECRLQDLAMAAGSDRSHFKEAKRAVDDKDIGAKIKTVMTRCIHCTRCVRFATEIAGVEEFGATGRGASTQIGTYVEQALQSEVAGNMIDLCPVGALTSKPYAFTARPWELVKTPSVDVLDAIGTPITADNRHGKVMRILPRVDETLNEEWLSDAARFSYDALNRNRLTVPHVAHKATGWAEAFKAFKKAAADVEEGKAAGFMGAMASMEEAYAFRHFMADVLATPHMDCRKEGSILGTGSAYMLSRPVADFESVGAVLLVGCNPRLEAPILNLRLRKAALKKKAKIAHIGVPEDLTYSVEQLGNDPAILQAMAKGKHPFADVLKATEGAVILVSGHVMERSDAAEMAAMLEMIARKTGATVSVLADTCGRVSALAMGVLPAANGKNTGKDTESIVRAWKRGNLNLLVVSGEDTVTAEDLKGGKGMLVYVGTHATELAKMADIVLPAAAWSERAGFVMNAEGRVFAMESAVEPSDNAKPEWKIWRALSEELGKPLPFNTLEQLQNLVNTTTPTEPATAKAEGELSAKPFEVPVAQHYLRLEYQRQSATMAACQAEVGTARARGV
jgi:NADH-quinone oxidoreductase subunit G